MTTCRAYADFGSVVARVDCALPDGHYTPESPHSNGEPFFPHLWWDDFPTAGYETESSPMGLVEAIDITLEEFEGIEKFAEASARLRELRALLV